MAILHSDGNGVTNKDNILRICLNGRYIQAYMVDGSNHLLGVYDTAERAQEVFDNLIRNMNYVYKMPME